MSLPVRQKNDELEAMIKAEKEKLEKGETKTQDKAPAVPDVIIEETEKVVGEAQTQDFQAETKKILDIVARSLYSDKEIFVRELISNASDTLERVRHFMLTGEPICDTNLPLEINISVDDKKKQLIIQDSGVGMSKEELIQNLGKIGFSGTSEFAKILEDKSKAKDLIGQFGVGFYSVFMVADRVKVYSKGYKDEGTRGWVWESDGSGTYRIAVAEPIVRGTKIVAHLRADSEEYSVKQTIESEYLIFSPNCVRRHC